MSDLGLSGSVLLEDVLRKDALRKELLCPCIKMIGADTLLLLTFSLASDMFDTHCCLSLNPPDDLPEGSKLEMVYLLGKLREDGGPLDIRCVRAGGGRGGVLTTIGGAACQIFRA